MEFRPLGNVGSPFCRTEWFHIHLKIAFFILSPECLAYWPRWLEVTTQTQVQFLAICSSGRKVSLGRKLQICKFGGFLKLENFNPISKFTYLKASSSRFGILAKAMQWCSKRLIFYAYKVKNHLNLSWWGGWTQTCMLIQPICRAFKFLNIFYTQQCYAALFCVTHSLHNILV